MVHFRHAVRTTCKRKPDDLEAIYRIRWTWAEDHHRLQVKVSVDQWCCATVQSPTRSDSSPASFCLTFSRKAIVKYRDVINGSVADAVRRGIMSTFTVKVAQECVGWNCAARVGHCVSSYEAVVNQYQTNSCWLPYWSS